jgi:D-3-phosphoglycerate dehydrogenase
VVVADKDDVGAIRREIVDADIVYPNKASLTGELMQCAKRLQLIHCGTGCDTVDLKAAEERGIFVCSTAHIMAQSTAEHTIFLLLALAKLGDQYIGEMRAGGWCRRVGTELAGKVIGILGYGHIGKITARIAHSLGMKVMASRKNLGKGSEGVDFVTQVDLETLLTVSDVISLHLPLISNGPNRTEALLGREELEKVGEKGLGWIVNTSRGALIDESALVEALQNGTIRKAALDVFTKEPLPDEHVLRSLSNVILTPHVAGETEEALKNRYTQIARNAVRVLRGETPQFIVTAP